MAFGGLNATARDYAKLGELFRNKGKWGERQLVSRAWGVSILILIATWSSAINCAHKLGRF